MDRKHNKPRRDKQQSPADNVHIPKIVPVHTDSDGQTAQDTSTNTNKPGA